MLKVRTNRSFEKIAIILLFFSFICHGTIILLVHHRADQLTFHDEILFCVGLSVLCSLMVFLFDLTSIFLSFHLLRYISLIVMGQMVPPSLIAVEILAILPFFFETAIYMGIRKSSILNWSVIIIYCFSDSLHIFRHNEAGSVFSLMLLFLTSASACGLSALVIYFREKVVSHEQQIEEYKDALLKLSDANKAFQQYADSIESKSTTKERKRITRELHDSVGYALTNIAMMMNAGKVLLKNKTGKLEELMDDVKQTAEEALFDTRDILYRLRTIQEASNYGLRGIKHLTKVFETATGVQVALNSANVPLSLGPQIDQCLYRLIQEGLTNALKHGRADKVRIILWWDDSEISAHIWDNGQGAETLTEGIGIKGMRERLEALGGDIHLENVSDGFELSAKIPFRKVV